MRLHRKRLANIKASVNMKKPKSMKKKRSTAKREQALREREDAIEYENQILMNKILQVVRRPNEFLEGGKPGAKSLNRTARKQENSRIQKENARLLSRLIHVRPDRSIDRSKHEKRFERHNKLLGQMRENSMNFHTSTPGRSPSPRFRGSRPKSSRRAKKDRYKPEGFGQRPMTAA
eukprot:g433.t1